MTIKAHLALTGTLFALLLASPAISATYKWIDEDGNVVYSQRPPPEGQYESIRIKPTPRSSKSPAETKSFDSKQWLKDSTDKRKDDNKVNTEVKKSQELRKKSCADAKQKLQFYTVYRRIKGKDGNYTRISDNERETKMNEAKQSIKDFCD